MKIFITGADGLLGSNLVRELLDQGHEVRALIYPGSNSRTLEGLALERIEGDLLGQNFDLAAALAGCGAVFHCAAITDLWATPELTWQVNLEGTRRLLETSLAARIKRFVFVGSASSFEPGPLEKPGDETGGFPAVYRGAPYMESKHAAAKLVREFARERGLPALIVAPTFLLGPFDSRPSGGELIRQYVSKNMGVATPGGRCFAYAPDAARAMAAALTKGRLGETYILGGHNLTYLDFFSRVAEIAGCKPPKRVIPAGLILIAGRIASLAEKVLRRRLLFNRELARFSLVGAYYSSDKAIRELGMTLSPVETAIADSLNSLKQFGHLAG